MNIICSGSRYQIYNNEGIKTYTKLPVGTYEIHFEKFAGFYLTVHNELKNVEEKIYGSTKNKINKVLTSFALSERNFGIILSGNKGSGKSLFARELSKECLKRNLPVIIVNTAIPGIASFLSSIEQEVMVLFDEFEKTFSFENDCGDKSDTPQEELLSLFDGLDNGKKLFVITCNKTYQLNDYLLNRPGRFHYHFRLGTVSPDEIKEYMTDKLLPEYQNNIDIVINASYLVEMTYDLLRAIAFELNQGYDLESTLMDLNIHYADTLFIDGLLILEDDSVYEAKDIGININESNCIRLYKAEGPGAVEIRSQAEDIQIKNNEILLKNYNIRFITRLEDEDQWAVPKVKELKFIIKNEGFNNNYIKSLMV